MTTLDAKILKQVEFYFSDSNLPKDKFLNEELKNNDGWLPIATLTRFARLKALSDDVSVIADALKKSPELLEVSEDSLKVKRKTDLPENLDQTPNMIYIKGFKQAQTLDEVTEFLAANGFDVKCVRMRYFKDHEGKKFKGSVFAELASAEDVIEASKKVVEGPLGTPLEIKPKAEYLDGKKVEVVAPKEEYVKADFVKGLLLKISNIGEGCSRETLKEWATKVNADVAYTDFSRGLTEATLRLTSETAVKSEEAAEKLTAIASELDNGGSAPTFTAVLGEDEEAAWAKVEAERAERRSQAQKRKPTRGGRGGRGGFAKRTRH